MKRLIFGCSGTELTVAERSFFRDVQPYGFILFGRNIETKVQVSDLTKSLRDAVGWDAPILIDQEGGRVQRLRGPTWTEFPPPLTHLNMPNSERLFWLMGRIIGEELNTLGIDVNCAPTLDVARDETHPFLQNRCYGRDADTVIRHAHAMIDGQANGGVASIMKHIPGHGRGTKDSHLALPVVHADQKELETDFTPFREFKDLSMGMSAHLIYSKIDPDHPATQSAKMIDLIRNQIGFGGLLMTDDISMEALSGDVVERSKRALTAGCDVTLHCNGDMAEMRALAETTGDLQGDAWTRAQHALKSRPIAKDVDISALRAEFEALVTKAH